jgi:hypothetical protein
MDHRDARAEGLESLRLALAAFALRLDALEARLKNRPAKFNAEPSNLVSAKTGFAKQVIAAAAPGSPRNAQPTA